eukprot:scaffold155299_cov22-Tisochrysis_lutea.AAC.2
MSSPTFRLSIPAERLVGEGEPPSVDSRFIRRSWSATDGKFFRSGSVSDSPGRESERLDLILWPCNEDAQRLRIRAQLERRELDRVELCLDGR